MPGASPSPRPTRTANDLLGEIESLRQTVDLESERLVEAWGGVPAIAESDGTFNMARYVALRRHDLRTLQRDLTPLGVSSLGRLEGHVRESLEAVANALSALAGAEQSRPLLCDSVGDFFAGEEFLRSRARALFGAPVRGVEVSVMVTIDPARASSPAPIMKLIRAGATAFRINCAHDDADAWALMARSVREAQKESGRHCAILVDLAGPKVRTGRVVAPGKSHRVFAGDRMLLVDEEDSLDGASETVQLTTTVPGLSSLLTVGDHVLIDDGRLDAVVEEKRPGRAQLVIVRTRKKGERLRPDKGLNVPGAELPIEALTAKDREDLDFAVAAADMVGLSYVRRAADVEQLQQELARRSDGGKPLGIVAKIETPAAFRALPAIIATGLRGPFAVMIARGDLAVEAGFERLAEVQEEMLWLCESAHVPVVWATQVLESLSREAMYSRAEVTDAAVAGRAECVMLNKGDHLPEAVASLNDLLKRMAGHQRKKSPQLRALRAW